MSGPKLVGGVEVTPSMVAGLFWDMDSEQQASFFAALNQMADGQLCQQMAYVVMVIAKRSQDGDYDALNGFQKMLAHAQDYAESATDIRVWQAKGEIDRMVMAARESQP